MTFARRGIRRISTHLLAISGLIWMFAVDISVVTFDRLIEAEEQYYCSLERDSISPACLVLTQGELRSISELRGLSE